MIVLSQTASHRIKSLCHEIITLWAPLVSNADLETIIYQYDLSLYHRLDRYYKIDLLSRKVSHEDYLFRALETILDIIAN